MEQEAACTVINDETIRRINELARKKKTSGLTKEEADEQQQLRQLYLQGMRTSLHNHLDNIKFVDDEEGGGKR